MDVQIKCTHCNGTGRVIGRWLPDHNCHHCHGKGFHIVSKPPSTIGEDDDEGSPLIGSDLAVGMLVERLTEEAMQDFVANQNAPDPPFEAGNPDFFADGGQSGGGGADGSWSEPNTDSSTDPMSTDTGDGNVDSGS